MRSVRTRDRVLIALSLCVAATLGLHRYAPDVLGLATAAESILPWFGLPVLITLVAAPLCRSWIACATSVLAVVVWCAMFVPAFLPKGTARQADLRIVSQNIGAANHDPAGAAHALAAEHADLVALQELSQPGRVAVHTVLDSQYQYKVSVGTVGLWSTMPLASATPLTLGLDWARALRTELQSPSGPVAIYVVHIASARFDHHGQRDRSLSALAQVLRNERVPRVILAGDLNTAVTDRSFRSLMPWLRESQQQAGQGFGFTWPSAFPVTRPDHILYRGMTAVDSVVLSASGSDHRAILAEFAA
jgi:vancomycin resistance protein VanJ